MNLDEIICGDNVAVMKTFPDACIDLVVTSPPYDDLRTYGGHSWDFEGVAAQLTRVIKPGGVIVWVVADATVNGSETGTSMRQALRFMELGMRLHDTMIWEKTGNGCIGSQLCYSQQSEFMFVLSKQVAKTVNLIKDRENAIKSGIVTVNQNLKPDGTFNRRKIERKPFGVRSNIWRIEPQRDVTHPAAFPEALAGDHIKSWSNEGDIVLDPFNGSGTTCKSAKILQRRWIGIDVNEDYCAIARKRLEQGVFDFS